MSGQQRRDAILSEIEEARDGAVRQKESAAQQQLAARKAASDAVSATQARIQHIDRQATGLKEHAVRTLADAGVSAEGRRTEAEVSSPASLEDAKNQMDRLAAQLTQTADQLQQARLQASTTKTRWQQFAVYLGVPLVAGAWAWWVGREPTEAAATFVLVAFAMWTVRKATTGKARPFAVGVAAFAATMLCIFAVDAFVPTGTMVYFAVLFALIAWRYLTLQARGGQKPAPKK